MDKQDKFLQVLVKKAKHFFGEMEKLIQSFDQQENHEVVEIKSDTESQAESMPTNSTDLEIPKKPVGSFFAYYKDHREEIAKSNPNLAPNEISKIIGENWRNLPKKDKEEYIQKNLEDKQKYQENLKKYKEQKKILSSSRRIGKLLLNQLKNQNTSKIIKKF